MIMFHIRPFTAADQPAARALVLAGLGDHFGWLDPARNPDLDDIAAAYLARGATWLVAERAGVLIGTGALTREAHGVGRLERMSVARDARRAGVGQALVARLLAVARARGDHRVVVETNLDWYDAIGLYIACGFTEYARDEESVHLAIQWPAAV